MRAFIVVTLATAALAAPPAHAVTDATGPPLSVESPASLGARFAIGADVARERLSGLEVDSVDFEIDFEEPFLPLPLGDLRSLDYEVELTLVGAQVPIALPRWGPVSLSMVLEGATVDGDFDLFQADCLSRSDDRALGPASYSGDGSLFGVGVEATVPLCGGCPVFFSSGYRFRRLSGLEVGAAVGSTGEDLALLPPRRLSGEVDGDDHQLTLRLGWQSPGGRGASYVGIRHSRHETSIGVEVAPLFGELPARARLDLRGDEVSGLAGVDLRLGRYAGRLEGVFGADRKTVLLKVVRGFGGAPGGPPGGRGGRGGGAAGPGSGTEGRDGASPDAGGGDEAGRDEGRGDEARGDETDWEERRARADQIADALVPELEALRSRFQQRRDRLETTSGPRGEEIYAPAGLRDLLEVTEAELLAALGEPELAPLRAWAEVFFADLRGALPAGTGPTAGVPRVPRSAPVRPGPPRSASLASASLASGTLASESRTVRAMPAQQPLTGGDPRVRQEGVLDRVAAFLDRLVSRTEAGELDTDVCLRSLPRPGVEVRLYPYRYPQRLLAEMTESKLRVVYRGLYAYEVAADEGSFACTDRSCPLLDLWLNDGPFVVCDFDPETCVPRPGSLERCEQP